MIDSALSPARPAATHRRGPREAGTKAVVGGVMVLAFSLGCPLSAQNNHPSIVQAPYSGELGHPNPDRDTPTMDPAMMRKRLRALNAERQKQMISDTNKLLKLARELSAETAGGDAKRPSPDQVHKAGEIEKLAHNVKDKMTYVVSGAPGEPSAIRPIY